MSVTVEELPVEATKETQIMGSRVHGAVQANLAALLIGLSKYRIIIELSLDIRNALLDKPEALSLFERQDTVVKDAKPDICVYQYESELDVLNDTPKETLMPLLAIEILSPMQGIQPLVDKIKLYLMAGVQSCWLVLPTVKTITVFSSPQKFNKFADENGEVRDENLDICLPMVEIFR